MREIVLDCAGLSSAQLHAALREALHFPPWYGGNLDALYDCLEELEADTHLVLINLQAPAFADTLLQVHNSHLTLELR